MWCMHTAEYYSSIKRNEVLIHATTWTNLENIMLSERSQSQRTSYCMIPFIENTQNRQIHRDKKQSSGCQQLVGEGYNHSDVMGGFPLR